MKETISKFTNKNVIIYDYDLDKIKKLDWFDKIKNLPDLVLNNLDIWNKIFPNNNNSKLLSKMHVLNSWYMLTKNTNNEKFLKDWMYWSTYQDSIFNRQLITYHHTADQSIFNILVYKYNFDVFFHEGISHNANKDRNLVLKITNNNSNYEQYFKKINSID